MLSITETPIEKLSLPSGNGNSIYIKRDDLQPFSFGGNKVRIADVFLEDMIGKKKNAMIIYGDRRSNLCRVLAAACAGFGFPCVMVCTSEHAENTLSFNERITGTYPVHIIACEKDGIAEAVDAAFLYLTDQGYDPYYIYGTRKGTGNEAVPVKAYVRASREIIRWEKEHDIAFDYVAAACGTGATTAGLIAGFAGTEEKTGILGISISSRTPERAAGCVKAAYEAYFADSGMPEPEDCFSRGTVLTDYNAGGYGICNKEIEKTIRMMLRENAIPFDPVYTGKAFNGLLSYLKEHRIKGKNILFIHTGGTPLFYDYMITAPESRSHNS